MLRPEDSWTYRRDSDFRREHHFRNLLQELASAIRREDQQLEASLYTELIQAYQAANRS